MDETDSLLDKEAPTSIQYKSHHCSSDDPVCFKFIEKIDPVPLIESINRYGSIFFESNRRNIIPEHRHTQSMLLMLDDCPALRYTHQLAERYGEKLVKAQATRLAPKQMVYPHFDRGDFYLHHDRYHIVVSSEGSRMTCGDQVQDMEPGEVWWFNNKLVHSAENLGDTWRLHVIFDVTTNSIQK